MEWLRTRGGTKEPRAYWEVVEEWQDRGILTRFSFVCLSSGRCPWHVLSLNHTQALPRRHQGGTDWNWAIRQGLYSQEKALDGRGSAPKPVSCPILLAGTGIGFLSISHTKLCPLLFAWASHHMLYHPCLWGVSHDGKQAGGRRKLCTFLAKSLLSACRCRSGWMERTKL